MRPIHMLAILGAMVASGPAMAQEYPSGSSVPGLESQAVERQLMARIQQQLKQDGYYRGQVDGMYGDQTRQALAQWQRDQGMPASGQLNAETLAAMDVGSDTQQAEVPQSGDLRRSGDVETLRDERMSSPNVQGEPVPERPGLGTPAPGTAPESIESPPRD